MLQVRDITVRFGGVTALDAVSLDVADGEVVGVIGPNGAGKTTLLNAISGFVVAQAGSITLDGTTLKPSLPAARRARLGLGRTFQVPRLFKGLTVAENLEVAASGGTRRAVGDLPGRCLEAVGAAHLADTLVDRLDAGDQRFVELARCLATKPSIVLLDEPATGLRDGEVDRLSHILSGIKESFGCSVLTISHDMRIIERCCARVVMLDFGRLVIDGTPTEVCNAPQVLAAYLGTSRQEAP
jgi:branched-chain amino acid transport system ATP-binding protein